MVRRIFYRCVDWNRVLRMLKPSRKVASFTDAWIETATITFATTAGGSRIFYRCVDWNQRWSFQVKLYPQSHLLQMRGLKRWSGYHCSKSKRRIFYRCVDWNAFALVPAVMYGVASFTDAWIETPKAPATPVAGGRIFYRCVDWNRMDTTDHLLGNRSHLLQMRGLKLPIKMK